MGMRIVVFTISIILSIYTHLFVHQPWAADTVICLLVLIVAV